eukprot:4396986-Amphidinium_carterae.1
MVDSWPLSHPLVLSALVRSAWLRNCSGTPPRGGLCWHDFCYTSECAFLSMYYAQALGMALTAPRRHGVNC